jgi:hypothetical protein
MNHIVQGNSLKQYAQTIRRDQRIDGLDLASLDNAIQHYRQAAAKLQILCDAAEIVDASTSCNEKIGLAEQHSLRQNGLPDHMKRLYGG